MCFSLISFWIASHALLICLLANRQNTNLFLPMPSHKILSKIHCKIVCICDKSIDIIDFAMILDLDINQYRYFGFHCIKIHGSSLYFVVMNNIFVPGYTPHERYDLKGSHIRRLTKHHVLAGEIMKDRDFRKRVSLNTKQRRLVHQQLHADTAFLAAQGIMDYSLLLGIYHVKIKNLPYLYSREKMVFKPLHSTNREHSKSKKGGKRSSSGKGGSKRKGSVESRSKEIRAKMLNNDYHTLSMFILIPFSFFFLFCHLSKCCFDVLHW